jgi:hypothetical protein
MGNVGERLNIKFCFDGIKCLACSTVYQTMDGLTGCSHTKHGPAPISPKNAKVSQVRAKVKDLKRLIEDGALSSGTPNANANKI